MKMRAWAVLLFAAMCVTGCRVGNYCTASSACAAGDFCIQIAPSVDEPPATCERLCGEGLPACPTGTQCICPDSLSGSRCHPVDAVPPLPDGGVRTGIFVCQ